MPFSELWLGAALAAPPDCATLDEAEFRAFVLDAQSAIDRGDIELPTAILEEIDARLPCLAFAPEPRMWADLLVSKAIVEFSRGGDWEDPLAAALRIRPAIDRGVGPSHPMASWEPPPTPASGPPVPPHTTLYVDGRPSPVLPPADGLWLVQRTDGRFWTTEVLHDEPLPDGFLEARIEGPPRIAAWLRAGALVGVAAASSRPDWSPAVLFPAVEPVPTALVGVGVDLHATFFSPFGVLASGTLAGGDRSGATARLSAILRRGPVTFGLGGGVAGVEKWRSSDPAEATTSGSVPVTVVAEDVASGTAASTAPAAERPVTATTDLLRHGAATLLLHGRGSPFDAQLVLGLGPAVRLATVDLGVAAPVFGPQRVRVSLGADLRSGRWVFPEARNHVVDATAGRVFVRFDAIFGEY